jgi:hypothetical protein
LRRFPLSEASIVLQGLPSLSRFHFTQLNNIRQACNST